MMSKHLTLCQDAYRRALKSPSIRRALMTTGQAVFMDDVDGSCVLWPLSRRYALTRVPVDSEPEYRLDTYCNGFVVESITVPVGAPLLHA